MLVNQSNYSFKHIIKTIYIILTIFPIRPLQCTITLILSENAVATTSNTFPDDNLDDACFVGVIPSSILVNTILNMIAGWQLENPKSVRVDESLGAASLIK